MKKETLDTFIELGINFSEYGKIRLIKENIISFTMYYDTVEIEELDDRFKIITDKMTYEFIHCTNQTFITFRNYDRKDI